VDRQRRIASERQESIDAAQFSRPIAGSRDGAMRTRPTVDDEELCRSAVGDNDATIG